MFDKFATWLMAKVEGKWYHDHLLIIMMVVGTLVEHWATVTILLIVLFGFIVLV